MGSEAGLPIASVCSFLLALARVTGAIVFVPIPGMSSSPEPARAMFALSLTMALAPFWPAVAPPTVGALLALLAGEAALGLAMGLVVALLGEGFIMFGQIIGLQAGFSFASTIDPNTQADSGVLVVLAQTASGLLFFATGLHLEVVRAFALSLQTLPPGGFTMAPGAAEMVIRLGSNIFSVGLRLALPIVALLLMVDIALALLGKINQQLQLLTLAFPVKMLASLALLAAMTAVFPRIYHEYAARLFAALPALATR
jgi:flagellar biosynthetic protein FliR